ncbi:unnamed protein product [Protopolystoma xenopodis]|uniref:Uncharacterized protein n=1 Tax=Protopolystoma xenopodis TaxID=117903 RepID=A0A3S5A4D3_9PLAT|nr:unnamed protein product [Protopolystoma xenopodis]
METDQHSRNSNSALWPKCTRNPLEMSPAIGNRRPQLAQVRRVQYRRRTVKALLNICKDGNQSLTALLGEAAVYVFLRLREIAHGVKRLLELESCELDQTEIQGTDIQLWGSGGLGTSDTDTHSYRRKTCSETGTERNRSTKKIRNGSTKP